MKLIQARAVRQAVFFMAALVLCAFKGIGLETLKMAPNTQIKLWARDAKIDHGLRIQDGGSEKATIHGWNSTQQNISWSVNVKKGNYKVSLRYSEPRSGSAITVTAGNQQFAVLVQPTVSWQEYREFDLGVLKVESTGQTEIVLQGIQLAIVKNGEGKDEHKEALPDVHWLVLTPTGEKEHSTPLNILEKFKGETVFNATSFEGWEGNNGKSSMEWFRIEKGCIVGGSLNRKIPRNEFIRLKDAYENFELRLQYKMVNSQAANGGVQFRSIPHSNIPYEMYGYQADIMSWKWGALYDEQRRQDFLGTPLNTEKVAASGKPEEWNAYIVRVEGPRIRIWLNGILSLDYIEYDSTVAVSGYIALQIHSGNPSEIWYKNIEIQEL